MRIIIMVVAEHPVVPGTYWSSTKPCPVPVGREQAGQQYYYRHLTGELSHIVTP